MEFSGIDLHSNNSVVLISDEADRIVYQKRLPNDLAQILAAVEPHRDELVGVVIESTYNWYWLVDGLMDAGHRVHLANPSGIRKYEGLKHSGDFADAAYLAQLLRLGLLAEGYIYPRAERGARDLARKRLQLVRYRTAQILSIEGILMRQTGARMKSESVKGLTAEQVEGFGFAPDVALAAEANRAVSQTLAALKAKPRRVKGRCSECGYFDICGGNTRVRARQLTGDAWAEDPGCYLDDDELGIEPGYERIRMKPYVRIRRLDAVV
jgi:transposase